MKDILARAQRGALARFARSNVLLAFDYDGTLAPIVADPARASMRARTRDLLDRLARIYPCVVISGRSRRDVFPLLEGVRIAEVVGNHGIEPHRPAREYRALVRRWRSTLAERLDGLAGVTVEDKGVSIAVHYRRSTQKMRSRQAILRATAGLPRARVFGGKDVVNVAPHRAPHKGTALETERVRLGCAKAIYVGDDETDEDVFSLRHPERFLTIRVGRKRGSRAGHCIRSQAHIDALLQALLALRERPAGAGSPPPQGRRRGRRLVSGSKSKKGAFTRLAAVSRTSWSRLRRSRRSCSAGMSSSARRRPTWTGGGLRRTSRLPSGVSDKRIPRPSSGSGALRTAPRSSRRSTMPDTVDG